MGERSREIKFRAWDGNIMHEDVVVVNGDGFKNEKYIGRPLQFTGLKDKNGKEIYEGDILYCHGATGVPLLQSYALPAKNPRDEKFIVVKLDCGFVLRHISTFGKSGYEIPNCIINGWTLMHNYDFWNHQRSFDVIGNIYANQELLGAEHE